jgi:hypothetical protein
MPNSSFTERLASLGCVRDVPCVSSCSPEGSDHLHRELCLNLGDARHQATRFMVSSVTSTPSLNLIPSMTFGN